MDRIGVRELRQNASRYLAKVASSGDPIEITEHGRPIARLVPITADPWADMIAAGEITAAARGTDVRDIEPITSDFDATAGTCRAACRRTMRTYLDTSALVKLVVAERESTALRGYLRAITADTLFTAALARTELVRAVAGAGAGRQPRRAASWTSSTPSTSPGTCWMPPPNCAQPVCAPSMPSTSPPPGVPEPSCAHLSHTTTAWRRRPQTLAWLSTRRCKNRIRGIPGDTHGCTSTETNTGARSWFRPGRRGRSGFFRDDRPSTVHARDGDARHAYRIAADRGLDGHVHNGGKLMSSRSVCWYASPTSSRCRSAPMMRPWCAATSTVLPPTCGVAITASRASSA